MCGIQLTVSRAIHWRKKYLYSTTSILVLFVEQSHELLFNTRRYVIVCVWRVFNYFALVTHDWVHLHCTYGCVSSGLGHKHRLLCTIFYVAIISAKCNMWHNNNIECGTCTTCRGKKKRLLSSTGYFSLIILAIRS